MTQDISLFMIIKSLYILPSEEEFEALSHHIVAKGFALCRQDDASATMHFDHLLIELRNA